MERVELEWTDTGDLGPDRPDYVARHGDKKVARVYLHKVGRGYVLWRWFVWWYAMRNSGHTESRRKRFSRLNGAKSMAEGSDAGSGNGLK